jgi:AraC family L-rhamnose operon transcriptional activator RhaR/AraC family L-rhamnose operon regulatory protein RhaS
MQTKQYNIIFQNDQDFPLRVRYEIQSVTPFHVHQFTEIVIILSGSGSHETKFSRNRIVPGDVFVIPKGGYHRYAEVEELELMNLLFDSERLPIPLIDLYKLPGFNALFAIKDDYFNKNRFYPKFHLDNNEFEKIKRILTEMREENAQMIPGYRCCLMGYFMVLVGNLSRLYTDNISEINEPSFKIGQAVSFINSNFRKNIKLEDIISKSDMSRSTFMRKFHQAIGTTPVNFLLQARMNEACRLLQQSNQNISEIAYQVGFNDSNYFTRQFDRMFGMTPRSFRQKAMKENSR